MLPLKLEINGFMSYGEKQIIDFEKLLRSGIFVIQGMTGAGKSTILDAITFALYGKVPRFKKKEIKSNFINHMRQEAKVMFEFVIKDIEEKTYRVERIISRSGGTDLRIWETVSGGYKEDRVYVGMKDGERRKALHLGYKVKDLEKYIEEKIIKLPYDIFIKTILLPQGEFAQLLNSRTADKVEIILKISGFEEQFNLIGDIAKREISKLKEEYERAKKEYDELKDLSEEDKKKMEYEVEKIEENIRNMEQKERSLSHLKDEILGTQSKLQGVSESLINLVDIKKIISQTYEIRKLRENILGLKAEYETYKILDDFISHIIMTIQEDSGKRVKHTIDKFYNGLSVFSHISQYIKDGSETIKGAISKLSHLISLLKEANTSIPQINILKQEIEKNPPYDELRKIIIEIMHMVREESGIEEEMKNKDNAIKSERAEMEKLTERKKLYEAQLGQEEQKISDIKQKLDKLKMEDLALEIRRKLRRGEKCPVCGNIYAGLPEHDRVEYSAQIDHLESELKKSEEGKERIIMQIEKLRGQIEEKEKNIHRYENEKRNNEQKLLSLNERRRIKLNEIGKLYGKYADAIDILRDFIADSTDELVTPQDILEKYGNIIEKLEQKSQEISKKQQEIMRKQRELGRKIEGIKSIISFIKDDCIPRLKPITNEITTFLSKISDFEKEMEELLSALSETYAKIRVFIDETYDKFPYSEKMQEQIKKLIESVSANPLSSISEINEKTNQIIDKCKLHKDAHIHRDAHISFSSIENMEKLIYSLFALIEKVERYMEMMEGKNEIMEGKSERDRSPDGSPSIDISIFEGIIGELINAKKLLEQDAIELSKKERLSDVFDLTRAIKEEWNNIAVKLYTVRDKNIGKKIGELREGMERMERAISELMTRRREYTKMLKREGSQVVGKIKDICREIDLILPGIVDLNKKHFNQNELQNKLSEIDVLDISESEIDRKIDEFVENKIFDSIAYYMNSLYNLVEGLRAKLKEHSDAVNRELEELSIEKRNLIRYEAEIKFKVGELEKKLKRKIELEDKIPSITAELDILDVIYNDFALSGGFKSFVSAVFLENVVNYASDILSELSTGRYSFVLKGMGSTQRGKQEGNISSGSDITLLSPEIRIYDSYYDAERMPESLSGGETFIASLSLALALAYGLMERASTKFRCFFIDEGFGSLDQNSLDLVINSLEKLAGKGIHLGIISHVESMKNVDYFAKLIVERDKRGFSKIIQE